MHRVPARAIGALAVVVALAAATAAPAGAVSDWDIDITASATVLTMTFGTQNTATYGQTITVPAGVATLDTFSIQVSTPATLVVRAALQAWDPAASTATGPVLYLSDPVSSTGAGPQTMTFAPGAALTPGTYVLYTTVSYDWSPTPVAGGWPCTPTDTYLGGTFVYFNNGDDEGLLTGGQWSAIASRDAAFTVVFTAAPVVPPTAPPVSTPAAPVVAPPAYTG